MRNLILFVVYLVLLTTLCSGEWKMERITCTQDSDCGYIQASTYTSPYNQYFRCDTSIGFCRYDPDSLMIRECNSDGDCSGYPYGNACRLYSSTGAKITPNICLLYIPANPPFEAHYTLGIFSNSCPNYQCLTTDCTGGLYVSTPNAQYNSFKCTPNSLGDCNHKGSFDATNGICTCWDASIYGASCEIDPLINSRCNGHGDPLCDCTALTPAGTPVNSYSTNQPIGCYCNSPGTGFTNRGTQSCLCDHGWGPDVYQGGGTMPDNYIFCTNPLACNGGKHAETYGTELGCQCIEDNYPLHSDTVTTQDPQCQENCALTRCSGHGQCFFDSSALSSCTNATTAIIGGNTVQVAPYCGIPSNEIASTHPLKLVTNYTNTCTCSSGWANDPSVSYSPSLFSQRTYCSLPYNPLVNNGQLCGFGQVTNGACVCSSSATYTRVSPLDWNFVVYTTQVGASTPTFYQPNSRGLCVPTCPLLDATTCDPYMDDCSDPTKYNNLPCGGARRGKCVTDGKEGAVCQCNNGYAGWACETVLCPMANSMICGGVGTCSMQTFTCMCNKGFVGEACETRVQRCSSSQTTQSHPLNNVYNNYNNLQVPNDLIQITDPLFQTKKKQN